MKYPSHLLHLIEVLKKLPGVGRRSAERFVFEFLTWPEEQLATFAELVRSIPEKIKTCQECGCLTGTMECPFCDSTRRTQKALCLIALPKDAFAIEETGEFTGLYHVLGGLLSPLDGFGPECLSLDKLRERIAHHGIIELIIALDATLEGDATALYLKRELASFDLQISRIAFGLPMGSSLDYVDGGTLSRAFLGRRSF